MILLFCKPICTQPWCAQHSLVVPFWRPLALRESILRLCGGSRAWCSWAHGPVTSQDCALTGGEPRDSRRLSLTTVRARRNHKRWKVTIVESWKPPDHLQGKWSLLSCLHLAVFRAPRLVWFMCLGRRVNVAGTGGLVPCLREHRHCRLATGLTLW